MASRIPSPLQSSLRRAIAATTTSSRGPLSAARQFRTTSLLQTGLRALATPSSCSPRTFAQGSSRPMSTGTAGGDDSSGRFSDDLEKLIARAGAKADRSGSKSSKAAAGEGGAVAVAAADGGLEKGEEDGEGARREGVELSARAMKFRAMISKLRPQKKAVVVKTFSPSREPLVDNLGRSYGLGRRKTSSARVWISMSEGKGGLFTVNRRPMIEYFPRDHLQNEILKPLEITEKLGFFHIRCTAKGGGQAGQAGAIRLGLSRALEAHDPWLRRFLKKAGMMERDSRKVERKKTGLKKARKAPQWVKR